jgi:hypothetical protein
MHARYGLTLPRRLGACMARHAIAISCLRQHLQYRTTTRVDSALGNWEYRPGLEEFIEATLDGLNGHSPCE